jgi:molybdopterin synthase sulfur carrier subunit
LIIKIGLSCQNGTHKGDKMVKIRFSVEFDRIIHTSEITLEIADTTVRTVIDEIIKQFGPNFEKALLEKGELRRFTNIYVNKKWLESQNLGSPVKDTDEIYICPSRVM